jgi:hypothetical protein
MLYPVDRSNVVRVQRLERISSITIGVGSLVSTGITSRIHCIFLGYQVRFTGTARYVAIPSSPAISLVTYVK